MDDAAGANVQSWVDNARRESDKLRVGLSGLMRYAVAGLPLSVLLSAVFYLQGRAYRYAFLHRLGLDDSLLPISTAEVFWWSLHGWTNFSVVIMKGIWGGYLRLLADFGLPVWVCLLVVLLLSSFRDRIKSAFYFPALSRLNGNGTGLARRVRRAWLAIRLPANRAAAASVFAFCSVSIVPLFLLALAVATIIFFLVIVFPFFQVGEVAAHELCEQDRATLSTVIFENGSASISTAYLIECREKYCALVDQAGRRFLVSIDDVRRVDIAQNSSPAKTVPLCELPEKRNKS